MKITKEQFMRYEDVRQSGVTNMFDLKTVISLSGLSEVQVIEIQKQYGELSEKFLKPWPRARVRRGVSMKSGERKKKECPCHESAMAHMNGRNNNCECKCHEKESPEERYPKGMPCVITTED